MKKYIGREDQDDLLQMLRPLFLDSKRLSKLVVGMSCVSSLEEQTSQFENRKPKLQAILVLLDSGPRQRGPLEESYVNRKTKLGETFVFKFKRARVRNKTAAKKET